MARNPMFERARRNSENGRNVALVYPMFVEQGEVPPPILTKLKTIQRRRMFFSQFPYIAGVLKLAHHRILIALFREVVRAARSFYACVERTAVCIALFPD